MVTIPHELVRFRCGADATHYLGSVALYSIVQAVFPELAVERGTADSQGSGDPRHTAAMVFQGKGDELPLDVGKGGDSPIGIEEPVRNCLPRFSCSRGSGSGVDM